ncbi:hypothetical protein ZIOFF_055156 [Zingiber officinale]|uniref:Uncharacterized protein n=1 Tax=Zingiber officinale TaxID=94328 RepID=A0A8J5FEL7_ZINOF|nr:hypothetical protein ZIOFF_055156 [Zingiber officinale]
MSHKVVSVAAGEAHTLVLTADGSLFSWGRGTFGRLGTSKEDDELFPVPIPSFASSNVSQANYIGIATGDICVVFRMQKPTYSSRK